MTPAGTLRLFLTLALLFSAVGACIAAPTTEPVHMSVDDAIARMLAHDPLVALAKLNVDAARIEHDKERAAEAFGVTRASETRTESNIKSAELAYSRQVNNAITDFIDDAYALQVAELSARTKQDQVAGRQQALDLVISKVASGAADKLDELSARADLDAAQADLFSAQLSTQQAQLRLRRRLALPEGTPVVIDGLPGFQTYSTPDDAFARARNADPDLVLRQAAVSLVRIELETARVGAAALLDIRKAEHGLAVAEAQLTKAEDDLSSSLQTAIAAAQQTANNYRSATMSLQLARQRHDIILQQNGTGQMTDLDVLYDLIALEASETHQMDALRSYAKALRTLEVLIGADLR